MKKQLILCLGISSLLTACNTSIQEQVSTAIPTEEPKKVVWEVEPTLEYTKVNNIVAYYTRPVSYDRFYLEMSGYSSSWQNAEVGRDYVDNVFTFKEEDTYGVIDDSGNILLEGLEPFETYDETINPLENPYSYPFIITKNTKNYILNSDFTIGEEATSNRVAGDNPYYVFIKDDEVYVYNNFIGEEGISKYSESDVTVLETVGCSYVPIVEDTLDFFNEKVTGIGRVGTDGTIEATYLFAPGKSFGNPSTIVNGYYVSTEEDVTITDLQEDLTHSSYGIVRLADGEKITKQDYEDVLWFEDGYCPVCKDGKWGFIDEEGNEVTDFIFDDVTALYDGKAYVQYKGHYGILNLVSTLQQGIEINEETCAQ